MPAAKNSDIAYAREDAVDGRPQFGFIVRLKNATFVTRDGLDNVRLIAAFSSMVAVTGLIAILALAYPALVHPVLAQSGEGAAAAAGETEDLYNLFVDAGGTTRSSVEVALRDIVERAGEDRVATRIEISGTQRDSGDYLILDLADEEPGEYELAVRVTDLSTGVSREAVRTIYVR